MRLKKYIVVYQQMEFPQYFTFSLHILRMALLLFSSSLLSYFLIPKCWQTSRLMAPSHTVEQILSRFFVLRCASHESGPGKQTPGFHWMRVRCGMLALPVHFVLRHPSAPTGCVLERSMAASVTRLWDFTVIEISRATTFHENLWSVDFRPGSNHYDVLLV